MKAETIKVSGGADYAKVAERLRIFREECPNGLIETTPTVEGNEIMFKARVLKDKAKESSGEATGHAIGEKKGAKAFEKLESIAVGRALAMLGYMASGEIASSEEMSEFNEYKDNKRIEAIGSLRECKTLDELKEVFMALGNLMGDTDVVNVKNELKLKLK